MKIGSLGFRQIIMLLTPRATHVLQWLTQYIIIFNVNQSSDYKLKLVYMK